MLAPILILVMRLLLRMAMKFARLSRVPIWYLLLLEKVAVLVQDAFRVNTNGDIRTGSVLGLRRLDIQDERWLRAMQAISEAVSVLGSKTYLRLYQRDARGAYQPISLDIAAVDHE